jgi:co-chaperonin GroES (HSP10)
MKIKPVNNQVLVRLDVVEAKSSGGIVLPTATRDREQGGTMSGVVHAIGADCFQTTAASFSVGDRVCFGRYAGGSVGLYVGDTSDEVARLWRLIGDTEIQAVEDEDGVEIA